MGLQLATLSILILPVDVANNMGDPQCDVNNRAGASVTCGLVDMYTMWESLFDMMGFVVVVFIPFAIFYYGAEEKDIDEKDKKSRSIFSRYVA